jgi:hypothetical protein
MLLPELQSSELREAGISSTPFPEGLEEGRW